MIKRDEIDMRARQLRKRGAGMVVRSGSGPTTQLDHLPDELVSEILTRLPAKSLHQCRIISKAWSSIIRDPLFSRAYLRQQRHGCLLISIADIRDFKGNLWYPENPFALSVYYSPLLRVQDDRVRDPGPFLSLMKMPAFDFFKGVTKVVNGLVCAYGSNVAMVCNVCTQETMWLPQISGFCNCTYEDYYFGYHPGNGVYKLLKISKSNSNQEAQILTLCRDSSWRKLAIELDESERFPAESFLCDGVIYWVMCGLVARAGLISFDLKTEKFQFISPPRDPIFSIKWCWWTLAKFRGRLALSAHCFGNLVPCGDLESVVPPGCFVLHTLDNCDYRGCSSWSRHNIPFPTGYPGPDRLSILTVGNLPTGQLLLTDLHFWKDSDTFIPIHSYDHQKNKYERFIVGSIPRETIRGLGLTFSISYVAQENIVSFDVLFGQGLKAKVDASIS